MDNAIPHVHEVYIVEMGRIDLLINGLEQARCCLTQVERLIEIVLYDRVSLASVFWAKPSSYSRNLINPLGAILCGSERLSDLLVLLLAKELDKPTQQSNEQIPLCETWF